MPEKQNKATAAPETTEPGAVRLSDGLGATEQLEWLWANCKILYWPQVDPVEYPIEHNPHAKKNGRLFIEAEMRKGT